jgi:hypothetical protein
VIAATETAERIRWAVAAVERTRRRTMAAETCRRATTARGGRSLGRSLGWNGLTRCVPWRVHTHGPVHANIRA